MGDLTEWVVKGAYVGGLVVASGGVGRLKTRRGGVACWLVQSYITLLAFAILLR